MGPRIRRGSPGVGYGMSRAKTEPAPGPGSRPKLVYVIPHLSEDETGHFAHIPALLAELGHRTDVIAVVERGRPPARLPGVRRVIPIGDRGLARRLLRTLLIIQRCSAAGYRTYFLRYSRTFTAVLLLTYPLFGHRVLLWRSGMSDLVEPGEARPVARRLDEAVNRVLSRLVHRLVTGPETMVGYMSRRWGVPRERVALLYNDIDADRFAPLPPAERERARAARGWAPEDFVVLFVHRLAYRRGTRLLPGLFHGMAAAGVPVRFVVAGDGPDRAHLERAAADPACAGRLHVLGPVPNRDLPALYACADCFLMPSYEEGFPRVLLEAMATALPIVTTDAGGSADVVGPGYPYVSRAGDTAPLLRHLLAVAAMPPGDRHELGRRLRARARDEYSTRRVAAMLAGLL
jgi:Glycosyltransferase